MFPELIPRTRDPRPFLVNTLTGFYFPCCPLSSTKYRFQVNPILLLKECVKRSSSTLVSAGQFNARSETTNYCSYCGDWKPFLQANWKDRFPEGTFTLPWPDLQVHAAGDDLGVVHVRRPGLYTLSPAQETCHLCWEVF